MRVPANAARVDGAKALQYTRELVAFGARPVGSAAHERMQNYLKSKLRADHVEDDAFPIDAPVGKFTGHNLIAKFPGKKDGIIVIAGHYETKYGMPNFVGANDGGSSAGLLLALADAFRKSSSDRCTIWLLWTDGEEAFVHWTDTDSLYGSRHLAARWKQDGTAAKIKALINVDMIGDADLDVEDDTSSDQPLRQMLLQATTNLGIQSHFFARQTMIVDDHLPFKEAGIPVLELIDFSYGYDNVFWHTPEDTMDKISAESLKTVGDAVLEVVRLLNGS